MSKADARRLLDRVEKDLPDQANACPRLKGEFSGLQRLRIGDYRVIFAIVEQDVIVLRISHRKDAYK
jgi:mRNA interferase RelE/StbE